MKNNLDAAPTLSRKHPFLLAIIAGGLFAGTLDGAVAFISFGWGMPKGIASGILGSSALQGGTPTWILGLGLHYFVASSAAAFYCIASRNLEFLTTHFLISGASYGIAVWLVMTFVVLPLSAFPFPVGPFTIASVLNGLLTHIVLVGLPISTSLRFFPRGNVIKRANDVSSTSSLLI